MKPLAVSLLGLLLATPVAAQDAFPIASAHIVNAPDIRNWPVTTTISGISVTGNNLRIQFSKRDGPDRWPDIVPPGFAGNIEYTVWLFIQVNGQWVGSGFVQMWSGRDGVGDAPSDFSTNWYYGNAWSPMQTHGPILPTEQIGIMVASGNERNSGGPFSVQERSNVVLISGSDNAEYTFQTAPPAPLPVPVPPPPPVVPPPVVVPPVVQPPAPLNLDLTPLLDRFDQLIALEKDTNSQVTSMNRTIGQTFGAVSEFIGKYIAPAVAAWLLAKKVG